MEAIKEMVKMILEFYEFILSMEIEILGLKFCADILKSWDNHMAQMNHGQLWIMAHGLYEAVVSWVVDAEESWALLQPNNIDIPSYEEDVYNANPTTDPGVIDRALSQTIDAPVPRMEAQWEKGCELQIKLEIVQAMLEELEAW